jgi:hypothetical protein
MRMELVAAAPYAVLAAALFAGGWALYSAGSMDAVPLYDAEAAADPAALAALLGLTLVAFGVATLAFAAVQVLDRNSVVVVAGYGVVVLCIALATAWRARAYE